eukprot:233665-Rhodomonas_salina.2
MIHDTFMNHLSRSPTTHHSRSFKIHSSLPLSHNLLPPPPIPTRFHVSDNIDSFCLSTPSLPPSLHLSLPPSDALLLELMPKPASSEEGVEQELGPWAEDEASLRSVIGDLTLALTTSVVVSLPPSTPCVRRRVWSGCGVVGVVVFGVGVGVVAVLLLLRSCCCCGVVVVVLRALRLLLTARLTPPPPPSPPYLPPPPPPSPPPSPPSPSPPSPSPPSPPFSISIFSFLISSSISSSSSSSIASSSSADHRSPFFVELFSSRHSPWLVWKHFWDSSRKE